MDPILIIALVVFVVLLVALIAISRRRRKSKAPRARRKGKAAPTAATPLSAEDEQLLETLGGTKRVVSTPAAETPAPKPVPETPNLQS